MEELSIGLDIGGSKMAFAVADRRGNTFDSRTEPTQSGTISMIQSTELPRS